MSFVGPIEGLPSGLQRDKQIKLWSCSSPAKQHFPLQRRGLVGISWRCSSTMAPQIIEEIKKHVVDADAIKMFRPQESAGGNFENLDAKWQTLGKL